MSRERPRASGANEAMPPLIAGGQGRSAEEIEAHARFVAVLIAIALATAVVLVVIRLLSAASPEVAR